MITHQDLGISRRKLRALEIIFGSMGWAFLILITVVSVISIELAGYFIVGYVFLWTIKIFGYSQRLIRAYWRLKISEIIPWKDRLKDLSEPRQALGRLEARLQKATTFKTRSAERFYRSFLLHAIENQSSVKLPDDLWHVVMVATYNEDKAITESTIQAIIKSDYDHARTIFVLAYEQRGGPDIAKSSQALVKQYGKHFETALAIEHPDGIAGEVKGKGPNITFAGRELNKLIAKKKIDPENIILTTLDADNRPSRHYFAYLTYRYAITEDRITASFQPMAIFFNNIWDAPALMRVIATSNSFWLLMESLRPHRLRNFSAHAQSFYALQITDFWTVKSIVEDGHQYWRSYFAFSGQHRVVPLYCPIYQDAVLAEGYWRTFQQQFAQLRRWAWGVSDTPYVLINMIRHKEIPLSNRIIHFFRQVEGYLSWATAPLILLMGGWLPLVLNPGSSDSILALQLPKISQYLQTISLLGLLAPVFGALLMLPPKPKRYGIVRRIAMLVQWVFVPFSLIVFGSNAALNAQTRLALGKYLEVFNVTEKKRVDDAPEV